MPPIPTLLLSYLGNHLSSYLLSLPAAASVELKSTVRGSWAVNILEQQRELATMRAVGTGSGRIGPLMISENLLLWLVALVLGLILGTLTARG